MSDGSIAAVFTLLGAAVGGLISYIATIKVADRKEMKKAAIDFHEAFLDALMSLDQRYTCRESQEIRGRGNVYEILERTFPQQIKAMLRFRLYLPTDKREKFDEAWKEYCHCDYEGGPESPFLEQYFESVCDRQPTQELALKRIYKLLSFVENAHKSPFEIEING